MPGAVFDSTEYDGRIARTKERVAERGLDALFVSNPANMNYFIGCNGWSLYVHQGAVVMWDRDGPVWVGRDIDTSGVRTTITLSEESIRPYSDDHVQPPHDPHPMDFVAAVLEDPGIDDARVGLEVDAYYFTAKSHTRLQKNLAETSSEDTTFLVNRVCIKKSDAELDYMCEAARVSENAMQVGLDVIEAGVPEYEAAEAIYSVLIEGADDYSSDYPSIVPPISSDDHTGAPHFTRTDREFEDSDPVIIKLSGCRHRYHSPLARTTFVGDPPEEPSRRADIVVEGMEAALDAVVLGVTYEAVEKVWRNTIAQHSIEKKDRIGYSIGPSYPPDQGEYTASLRPGDETALKENMTFHTTPGLWFDDFGVGLSETFVVMSDGVEPLADLPRRLFIT